MLVIIYNIKLYTSIEKSVILFLEKITEITDIKIGSYFRKFQNPKLQILRNVFRLNAMM